MSQPEAELQKQIVKAARELGFLVVMINNAAKRNYKQTAYLKAMGMLPGAADLVVIGKSGRTLWLEIKSPKGIWRDNQKEFCAALQERKHTYQIADNYDLAIRLLRYWQQEAAA